MLLKFHPKDIDQAKKILASSGVKNVVFSQNTYQIEVVEVDSLESTWIFIQLDGKSEIQDCFCTCKKAEYTQSCPHLAAGALAIFSEKKIALHDRYEQSILCQLFFIIARRFGFESTVLSKEDDSKFFIPGKGKKELLSIYLKNRETEQKLQELFERPQETEENSIKFSNLSADDLQAYRDHQPSIRLQYELSFWSDFSKWIFYRAQSPKDLTIHLIEDENLIPTYLELKTKDIEVSVFLSKVNWQELIESLKPYLPVHEFSSFTLEKIEYLPKEKEFIFHKSPSEFSKRIHEAVDLDKYLYISSLGFFPKEDGEIFHHDRVKAEDIPFFLKQYRFLVEKYLADVPFQKEKIKAQYDLFFDDDANFHIELYAEEPKDLDQELAGIFIPYVYLENKGFFRFKELFFEGTKKIIPPSKMSQFIEHFKHWLNQFEGFQIHLSSLDSAIKFSVNDVLTLQFFSREQEQVGADLIDLDEWIYLKGFGFSPKTSTRSFSNVRPGMQIEKESIGSFIEQNQTELEWVQGFFLSKSPVKSVGLKVSLNHEMMIEIEPMLDLISPEYEGKITVFGSFGFLKNSGFFPLKDGFYLPKGYEEKKVIPRFVEEQFVHFELNQIQKYIIDCDPRLKRIESSKFVVEQIKEEEKKKFSLKVFYETSNGKIPLGELIEPVLLNKSYVMTDAGLIFLEDGKWDFLKVLGKRSYSKTNKEIKVSFLDWIKVSTFIKPEFSKNCDPALTKKLQDTDALLTADGEQLPELTGFQSNLRPYQKVGLKWLWHLYNYDLSGILADDMGLGKTHQAMSLLAACLNKKENLDKKYLVVCPTSVIYHWQNLLKNFLPNAKVMMFYGPSRSLKEFEQNFDILLTSYGTLRSDAKEVSNIKFEVAILDEMHVAKNQQSQIHKSLKKLSAAMKLGLTGTPIENDLSELKALFDVVLPLYFPDSITFKEQFVFPIEKYDDPERKKILKRMIAPFVLRRKKTEVLQDLPEKIEEISYVDLSDEQKVLYKKIVEEKHLKLNEMDEEENFYFHVFQLFNKLKQLCNHPALVLQDVANYKNYQSGKFELFKELIQEARQSKQKVVVFTQYLGMIEILRMYLDEEKIGYAGIQGNTRDRKEQIEKFKNDETCEVFLASLQAAGVGIDLVSASIVIHYDRWWNPAKENQATDRVHRIGQTRGVQVFKFVSKDTVEEHIHEMILRKMNLAQSVVGYDEEFEIKKIDRQELMHLLKLVNQDI